jgi:hypothetical protein
MNPFRSEQIEFILVCLEKYANVQEKIIQQHYLDSDHETLVEDSQNSLDKCNELIELIKYYHK